MCHDTQGIKSSMLTFDSSRDVTGNLTLASLYYYYSKVISTSKDRRVSCNSSGHTAVLAKDSVTGKTTLSYLQFCDSNTLDMKRKIHIGRGSTR